MEADQLTTIPPNIHPEDLFPRATNVAQEQQRFVNSSRDIEEITCMSFREKCMRDAIQQHISKLVNTLPFNESEIPDSIIQEGIATPTESESLRKLRTTENQVSGLVSLVITKDSTAMEKFLVIVAVHNTDVVEDIRQMANYIYEENKEDINVPCALCNLKEKCNITVVFNQLFERGHISASLHRRVVYSDSPVGCQDELWDAMFRGFGVRPDCSVIRVLVEALEHDGCCNSNVIRMLKRLLRKNMPLECSCHTEYYIG